MRVSIKSKFGASQRAEFIQDGESSYIKKMTENWSEWNLDVNERKELTIRILPNTKKESLGWIALKTLLCILFFPVIVIFFWLFGEPEGVFSFSPCTYEIKISAGTLLECKDLILRLEVENPEAKPAFQRFSVKVSVLKDKRETEISAVYVEKVDEVNAKIGYMRRRRLPVTSGLFLTAVFMTLGFFAAFDCTGVTITAIFFSIAAVFMGLTVLAGIICRGEFKKLLKEAKDKRKSDDAVSVRS